MPFSDSLKNDISDAIDANATHLSLHTAYSPTGANEVAGGSPAYARQPFGLDPSADGEADLTDTEVFDVPAGTYGFVGMWDALSGGTFKGMHPLGGGAPNPNKPFFGEDTGDLIRSNAHGYSDNDTVVFFGDALPTGITEGVIYFVISAAANTFQVSTTQGGSAVTITADGEGIVQAIVTETFNAQGTLTINSATFGLNLLT